MRFGLMACAFIPIPKRRPQPSSTGIPFSQNWEGRLPWPCPHGEQLCWLDALEEIPWWELHTCMKIRDKLEAKVVA